MRIEHDGQRERWETFASGKAIFERYGKHASEIHDIKTWKEIAHGLASGIIELIAVIQPDVIVLGGSVGAYFERYAHYLREELEAYSTPLTPTPVIREAKRPSEAVVVGCYELAKARYGKPR